MVLAAELPILGQASGGTAWSEAKLVASDGKPTQMFARSVAVIGDTAVVGSIFGDGAVPGSGAAYIYERAGTRWVERTKLAPADGAAGDFFGQVVGTDGRTITVAAEGDDDLGYHTGAVYVFRRTTAGWVQEDKILPPHPGVHIRSAHSVSGDTVIVGAYTPTDSTGAAYVFVRVGATWVRQATLDASDGRVGDFFGTSISVDGDLAIIGAPGHRDRRGASYIFARSGNEWTQEAKVMAGDGLPQDHFGHAVAIDAATAVVGVLLDGGSSAGAAYVFERQETAWPQTAKLLARDGTDGARFGASVDVDQRRAVVGATFALGKEERSGAIYCFERSPSGWSQVSKLVARDGTYPDALGTAVSLFGDTVLGGAQFKAVFQGAAYVFRLFPPPRTFCTPKPGLVCGVPAVTFSGSPSANVATGFFVQARPVPRGRRGLVLYSNRGRAVLPFQGGTLCLSAPVHRSPVLLSRGIETCDGAFSLDWNAFAYGMGGGSPRPFLREIGSEVVLQFWSQDSPATGASLSGGLAYTVLP